jgi:hypothetical protein
VTKKDDILGRFRPAPGVLPADAVLTADDLRSLCDAPSAELQRQIDEAREAIKMNAMSPVPDWHRRGINACQLLYARLIADLLLPEEKDRAERAILNLIEAGGWPMHQYDIKLIRLAIIGCGFFPNRPLKFKHKVPGQDNASARSTA